MNAIEPGSYVRPHRHPGRNRWEWFHAIAGAAVVLVFSAEGKVLRRVEIKPEGPVYGVEIPAGAWHTIASLVSGTVLFELKPGPYNPGTDKEFASWSPSEADASCPRLAAWFSRAEVGDLPEAVSQFQGQSGRRCF